MHRMLCLLIYILIIILNSVQTTPLDDYVNTPDAHFSWKRLQTYEFPTYKLHVLNMTSQQWLDASFSSQSLWWHYMIITVPHQLRRSHIALMLIEGGRNTEKTPINSFVTDLGVSLGSVAVELRQIPNEPIQFTDDPTQRSRTEDALIAWTWKTFIEQNGTNPNILLQLPMTKAAVRAMDATEQFLQEERLPVPKKFIIAGGSKRGWITWTTAAVNNQRVLAAIPAVINSLNFKKNLMHHYRSLAGWTFAFSEYYAMNITRYIDNPYLEKMAAIIDPYVYLDRFAEMKLFQLQAANDEFFLPDSEEHFWNDLQMKIGGSYLRRIPNIGHFLLGYEESLKSFCLSIADQQMLPSMKWTRTINETHGQIRTIVNLSNGAPIPIAAKVYQASTVTRTKRDFRLFKLNLDSGKKIPNPAIWLQKSDKIESQNSTSVILSYTAPIPRNGYWHGMFMQLKFLGPEGTILYLTTETLILPNTFPVDQCIDDGCYGTLV